MWLLNPETEAKWLKKEEKRLENAQKHWVKVIKNPPSKLYHLSFLSKRTDITNNGLIPKSHTGPIFSYENRVFIFTGKTKLYEIMDMVGYDGVDLWEIDNTKLNLPLKGDEFAKMKRCFYTEVPIPAQFLKFKKTFTL